MTPHTASCIAHSRVPPAPQCAHPEHQRGYLRVPKALIPSSSASTPGHAADWHQ